MELLLVILGLSIFAVLSQIVGVDSTDSSNDPRGPARPVGIS